MLDQDTARALLTLADQHNVRVALLGDRHQLSAVGRGGVLDLAARWATPDARVTLDTVHRFTRMVTAANGASVTAPDQEYAALSLSMRTGDRPGEVFDTLRTRGQIAVHPSEASRTAALAQIAAAELAADRSAAILAGTREQAADLNTAIRDRLVATGQVDDHHTTTTTAGQRLGVGDRVTTRRNHRHLDVANRDGWTVTVVDRRGGITVTGEQGSRDPAGGLRQPVCRARLRRHHSRRARRHRHHRASRPRRAHRRRRGLRRHDPRPHRQHRPPDRRQHRSGPRTMDQCLHS